MSLSWPSDNWIITPIKIGATLLEKYEKLHSDAVTNFDKNTKDQE